MTPQDESRLRAAQRVADVCFDALLDKAEGVTCQEADVLTLFLVRFRSLNDGVAFMAAHIEGDEPTDEHKAWRTQLAETAEHIDLGQAYSDRMTLDRDLTPEDEQLVRELRDGAHDDG